MTLLYNNINIKIQATFLYILIYIKNKIMNLNDLMQNAQHLTSYEFEKKLNKLVRENYHYRNLDEKNKKIILDLVKKWKSKIRQGIGVSNYTFRHEIHRLYEKRLKLNLTEEDLKDIKKIMSVFIK